MGLSFVNYSRDNAAFERDLGTVKPTTLVKYYDVTFVVYCELCSNRKMIFATLLITDLLTQLYQTVANRVRIKSRNNGIAFDHCVFCTIAK